MFHENHARQRGHSGQKAFSLVEVMIVLVILGLLASVVTLNVRSYLIRAKQSTARQEISVIVQGLSSFYAEYDRYPTNEEGLEVLTTPSEKIPEPLLDGKLTDPWDRPYQYNAPGANGPFEVISYGANEHEGGDGADADIRSDDLKK